MKKVVIIFSNYLQPVFVKLMLQSASAIFFYIFVNEFFYGISQELGKSMFFEIAFEIDLLPLSLAPHVSWK